MKARSRVDILIATAELVAKSPNYQWGHVGMCNCGHLARVIRDVSPHELHRAAMVGGGGDWSDRARDYCPDSGLLIDDVISEMLAAGFTLRDIARLERLSDPAVLKHAGVPSLSRNRKDDVVRYLRAWAELLSVSVEELDLVEGDLGRMRVAAGA